MTRTKALDITWLEQVVVGKKKKHAHSNSLLVLTSREFVYVLKNIRVKFTMNLTIKVSVAQETISDDT